MPELPEVEIVRRALEPAFAGQKIRSLKFNRPNLRFDLPSELLEKIQDQQIDHLQRRGKYILAFAQNGHGFILHLGMSGVVRIEPDKSQRLHEKHDHVEFELANDCRIVLNDARRFGFLQSVHIDDWSAHPSLAKMGPEPLSNDFSGPVLYERLKGKSSPIKVALLDQRIVAGVGNIYACEALYMAGISPFRAAKDLSEKECESLSQAIRDVLNKAIEKGGSSLKDYKHTDGKLGYFQHQFAVYDRQGVSCTNPKCDRMAIKREVQAGRSTFYCSNCQR